jgi:hypothetical protein
MSLPYIGEESSSALRNYIDSLMAIWLLQQTDKYDAAIAYRLWEHAKDRMKAVEEG